MSGDPDMSRHREARQMTSFWSLLRLALLLTSSSVVSARVATAAYTLDLNDGRLQSPIREADLLPSPEQNNDI